MTQFRSVHRALAVMAILAAGLALASAPVGASTTVSVTPNTGVVDGTTVTVHGEGFPVGRFASTTQCASQVLVDDDVLRHCELGNIRSAPVRPDGSVDIQLVAHRFIPGADGPIDCAESGTCVVGIAVLDPFPIPETVASTEIDFDDTLANDPPLTIEATVDRVDQRSVGVTLTCSRRSRVLLSGHLRQARGERQGARLNGTRSITCEGETASRLLPVPEQFSQRGVVSYPFSRLLAGPAELLVTAYGSAGRWDAEIYMEQQVDIDQPNLLRRRAIGNGGITTELLGVRITQDGRATARVAVTCASPIERLEVTVRVLAAAPGAAYRHASGATVDRCEGTITVGVELNALDYRSHRVDIVRAGPVEGYAIARDQSFGRGEQGEAVAMRPMKLRRDIIPEVLRVRHRPSSRLRIGAATTEGVTVSFRCRRTAPFTVAATIGQPRPGDVVRIRGGTRWIDCVAGRTVVFEVDWVGPVAAGQRSAITVQAVNGQHFFWEGPWQRTQQGWRTT